MSELDELRQERDELLAALKLAVQIIRAWRGRLDAAEAQSWALYQASDEMKQINGAITRTMLEKP